jgi:uncharacterized membrane protein
MDLLKPIAEFAAIAVGGIGIAIITVTAAYSLLIGGKHMLYHRHETETIFREIRQRLGRGILLGLEFLIAADIMLSVTIDLSFERAGVLIMIVLVRAFLSFTLEVELTGKWPWHQKPEKRTQSSD